MNFEALNPTLNSLLKTFKLDIKYTKGNGLYLYDGQGTEYLDFIAQYGSVPFGYSPPDIIRAAEEFLHSGIPTMVQPSVPVKAVELAELLIKTAPGEMAQATFCQSGAEAVEIAIKLARSTTGKFKILSTDNSFHGKTMGALSATGRKVYQEPFFIPVPGFDTVPFNDLPALEAKLQAGQDEIAAFIIEPVQGEGGIIIPDEGYLKAVEGLCRKYGVLMIVDEIQTGLGRTGSLFACEREEVCPDILLLSKALGGGLVPIGVCLSTKQAWNEEFGKLHSSTFANNNFTCAIGVAVLQKLTENNRVVVKNCAAMGQYLLAGLKAIDGKYPGVIREIRGRGLMVGVEFNDFDGSESFSMKYLVEEGGFTALLAGYLLHLHHIRCAPFLNNPMTLRLQPSLTVSRREVGKALKAIEHTVRLLYLRDYSEFFGYLIGRKLTGPEIDCRERVRPVRGSVLAPEERAIESFAFIIHYPALEDVIKNNPSFAKFSTKEINRLLDWEASADSHPQPVVHLPAIRSKTGKIAEGWLIAIPYSGRHLLEMPRKQAVDILAEAVEQARKLGAKVVGLGAYTSVVSRGGADLLGKGPSITSGNSYTIATAFDAVIEGAALMGIDPGRAVGSVVGATGSIGRVCAMMLADEVEQLYLVGNPEKGQASIRRIKRLADEIYQRLLYSLLIAGQPAAGSIAGWLEGFVDYLGHTNPEAVEELRQALENNTALSFSAFMSSHLAGEGRFSSPPVKITLNIKEALRFSDLVISASSATSNLIGPEILKPGSVVCDIARPADVSRAVLENRPDVLVMEGGLVSYPDKICFGQNMGYEPGMNLACLSETMLLALEGDYRDFSIGTKITMEDVEYLRTLAGKHGFKLARPQNEKGEITADTVEAVKKAVEERSFAGRHELSQGKISIGR